jgi:predicted transcriptional regulator
VQEGFGDAADFGRHRRREEQRLPRERDHLADALDVGNEAHVEHAVGFVDDQQFDAGQQQAAALGMVEQPAGRCDQHVDAAVNLVSWSPNETPPISSATLSFWPAPYLSKFSFTWAASSRVGSRMRVRGMRARARPFSSMVSIGRTKAAVLPVPVWAMPRTSLFAEQYPKGLGPTLPELLALAPDAPVVPKVRFSAVGEPALLDHLEGIGRRTVVLCGLESHVCVLQSAVDLHDAGFRAVVAIDATTARNPRSTAVAELRLVQGGIEIVTAEMACFEWLGEAGTDEFRTVSAFLR